MIISRSPTPQPSIRLAKYKLHGPFGRTCRSRRPNRGGGVDSRRSRFPSAQPARGFHPHRWYRRLDLETGSAAESTRHYPAGPLLILVSHHPYNLRHHPPVPDNSQGSQQIDSSSQRRRILTVIIKSPCRPSAWRPSPLPDQQLYKVPWVLTQTPVRSTLFLQAWS